MIRSSFVPPLAGWPPPAGPGDPGGKRLHAPVIEAGGFKKVMARKTLDVRKATCPGGGALWSLLSHTREIPRGGSLEFLTDDYQASSDIPVWAARGAWTLATREVQGGCSFVVARPV